MTHFKESDRNRTLALVVVIAFAAAFTIYSMLNPIDNWDMLGYAGSAKSLTVSDPDAVHAAVYAEYRAYATPENYQELTADSSYRIAMHNDAEAFNQQIPYYKIRVVYIFILALLAKLGIDLFSAMHVLSPLFAGAALIATYVCLRDRLHSFLWMITPALFYVLSDDLRILQFGGVDTLALLWMSLITIAFVRDSRALLPLVALSVLIRTDLIIYAALMYGVVFLLNRSTWRQTGFWGVATLLLYTSVNMWAGNHGWNTLIQFVFVSDMSTTHPELYSDYSIDPKQYWEFLTASHGWVNGWLWVSFFASLLTILIYFVTFHDSTAPGNQSTEFLATKRLLIVSLICPVYVALHYLLFPSLWMRFFLGHCYFAFISFFAILSYAADARHVTQYSPKKNPFDRMRKKIPLMNNIQQAPIYGIQCANPEPFHNPKEAKSNAK